ncbi:MAG TPA: hypothetical protein VGI24_05315 [Solirubrobacteraceae bacterium]|jgi:hypothetical protein
MSTATWMRRQRDRPIAEHERRTAMTAVVVVLAAAAVLFTVTQPSSDARRTGANTQHGSQTAGPGNVDPRPLALTPEATQIAARFLAGYLSYAYGHSSVRQITGGSRALILTLESRPPRISPAALTRHPRVVSLRPIAAPAGEVVMTAMVNDGGLIDYPIGLVLASDHGRLLVTGLEGE